MTNSFRRNLTNNAMVLESLCRRQMCILIKMNSLGYGHGPLLQPSQCLSSIRTRENIVRFQKHAQTHPMRYVSVSPTPAYTPLRSVWGLVAQMVCTAISRVKRWFNPWRLVTFHTIGPYKIAVFACFGHRH